MKVAEIYRSIQGEGFLTGTKSVFVRASGCNLRCIYCDTPYASWEPTGLDRSVTEIAHDVLAWDTQHVVLTGGEPMLFAELIPLCRQLRDADRHLTVETAGTLYLPVDCDLMSISPKTKNSVPPSEQFPQWNSRHQRHRHAPDVIRQLVAEFTYQFKFVIETPHDLDEVLAYLDKFPEIERGRVMLMPQAKTLAQQASIEPWLSAYCKQNDLHYCPRRHIEWFGCAPGT
jgi:7-carboxy-7-deazaguanine synthase